MPATGFRCVYCKDAVKLSGSVWERAYQSVLEHVAPCGRKAGAHYDEMREYISAVMADWPATTPARTPAARRAAPRKR